MLAELGDDADQDGVEQTCEQLGRCLCSAPASSDRTCMAANEEDYELALEWAYKQAKTYPEGL